MEKRHRLSPKRLGPGDHDHPDRSLSRDFARYIFLAAVAEEHPLVLADLAGEPMEVYLATNLHEGEHRWLYGDLRDHLNGATPAHYRATPDGDQLIAVLTRWAQRWHLNAPWCLAHALETLDRWRVRPEDRGNTWNYFVVIGATLPPVTTEFAPQLDQRGWSPELQMWTQFADDRRAEFEEELARYRQRVEGAARDGGMVSASAKAPTHFVWLAIFQPRAMRIENMLLTARQNQPTLSRSALESALREAAKFIGLELRDSPFKGRKVGSHDKGWRHVGDRL